MEFTNELDDKELSLLDIIVKLRNLTLTHVFRKDRYIYFSENLSVKWKRSLIIWSLHIAKNMMLNNAIYKQEIQNLMI